MCEECNTLENTVSKDIHNQVVNELTDEIASLAIAFDGPANYGYSWYRVLVRYAPEKARKVDSAKKMNEPKDPPDKNWIEDGLESIRKEYWGGVKEEPPVLAEKNILRVNSREKHDFLRTTELCSVINAYLADAEIIPIEWLVEYNELRERWQTQ